MDKFLNQEFPDIKQIHYVVEEKITHSRQKFNTLKEVDKENFNWNDYILYEEKQNPKQFIEGMKLFGLLD